MRTVRAVTPVEIIFLGDFPKNLFSVFRAMRTGGLVLYRFFCLHANGGPGTLKNFSQKRERGAWYFAKTRTGGLVLWDSDTMRTGGLVLC
jgi:hypothetical protein